MATRFAKLFSGPISLTSGPTSSAAKTITRTNYPSSGISPRPYLFGLRPRPTRISTTTTTTNVASPPPMMARLLAQTLTLARPGPSPSAATSSLRGLATKVEVIEIDLTEEDPAGSSSPGSPTASPSVEVVGIRRLEEAIHGVMVRRATPDWLPFVPGGSFWVPPLRRPHGVAEIFSRIAAAGGAEGVVGTTDAAVEVMEIDAPLTEEEALSFSTARGWPSASYFVDGKFQHSRNKSEKWAAQTDDEES